MSAELMLITQYSAWRAIDRRVRQLRKKVKEKRQDNYSELSRAQDLAYISGLMSAKKIIKDEIKAQL